MENFNKLTPEETERLALLSEECGEVIQLVGKILRHGYESYHPNGEKDSNRIELTKELGDLCFIVHMMLWNKDIDKDNLKEFRDDKPRRLKKYVHHTELPPEGR